MKKLLSIKTLFRAKLKTLVTFLLVAAVTFALFSQVAEYINTKLEFENNTDMYYGYGTVEASPATYKNAEQPYYIEADPRVDCFPIDVYNEMRYEPLTQEQIEAISALPYVSSTYVRYMTGGICDSMTRCGDYLTAYDFSARLVIEGTLTEISQKPFGSYLSNNSTLFINDIEILAGEADAEHLAWMPDGNMGLLCDEILARVYGGRSIESFNAFPPDINASNSLTMGHNTEIVSVPSNTYVYNYDYLNSNLKVGNRYVFIARFPRADKGDKHYWYQRTSTFLYDFLTEPWCKSIWDITNAPDNYLELEEFESLQKCIEITNQDIHTFDVVYTDDMSVIKQVYDGNIYPEQGRFLTPEDTENNSPVCVINSTLAKTRNLKIGDKIALKLGDELFEQYYGLGAVAVTPERFSDNWTEETEFEIVGIYDNVMPGYDLVYEPNWSYSNNTIFVPMSFLPLTDEQLNGHEFSPSEFNFKVDNAWDIKAFTEECIPQIEAMGLTVTFDDGGWLEVVKGYTDAQNLSIIRITILSLVTLIATGLVVYLYINRRRKDYAIMRALGTTQRQSALSLLLPFMILCLIGIAAGIITGIIQTTVTGNRLFPWSIILVGAGEFVLILIFTVFSLQKLGKKSPLALLQDSSVNSRRKKAVTDMYPAGTPNTSDILNTAETNLNIETTHKDKQHTNPHSARFAARYISLHIRRSIIKSLLSILLAVFLLGTITMLAKMQQTYTELHENTSVTARFITSLKLHEIPVLKSKGYAEYVYYQNTEKADINYSYGYRQIDIIMTNDIGRYINESYEIEYAPGYDESCISELGDVIILGKDLMETHGYSLGDTVRITPKDYMQNMIDFLNQEFMKTYPGSQPLNQTLYDEYSSYIETNLEENADHFTIAGVITTPSNAFANSAFTPGKNNRMALLGTSVTLDLAEFRLADNSLVNAMKEYGNTLTEGKTNAFVMDTSKLDSVIRTSEILNSLYPAAVAAALVIGAFLCALIIFQTSTEAAIMRVLGTTKKKTAAILTAEQAALALLGIILGTTIMAAVNGGVSVQSLIFSGAYFAVILISSAVSSFLTSRRNILDLLQTKE